MSALFVFAMLTAFTSQLAQDGGLPNSTQAVSPFRTPVPLKSFDPGEYAAVFADPSFDGGSDKIKAFRSEKDLHNYWYADRIHDKYGKQEVLDRNGAVILAPGTKVMAVGEVLRPSQLSPGWAVVRIVEGAQEGLKCFVAYANLTHFKQGRGGAAERQPLEATEKAETATRTDEAASWKAGEHAVLVTSPVIRAPHNRIMVATTPTPITNYLYAVEIGDRIAEAQALEYMVGLEPRTRVFVIGRQTGFAMDRTGLVGHRILVSVRILNGPQFGKVFCVLPENLAQAEAATTEPPKSNSRYTKPTSTDKEKAHGSSRPQTLLQLGINLQRSDKPEAALQYFQRILPSTRTVPSPR